MTFHLILFWIHPFVTAPPTQHLPAEHGTVASAFLPVKWAQWHLSNRLA